MKLYNRHLWHLSQLRDETGESHERNSEFVRRVANAILQRRMYDRGL